MLARMLIMASAVLLGCSAMLDRAHDQCRTSQDCQRFGMGAVCTENGTCSSVHGVGNPGAAGSGACKMDSDCRGFSICRSAACYDLEQNGCTALGESKRDPDAEYLPIALLLPESAADAGRFKDTVATAATGWNAARLIKPELPQVLPVACQASDFGAVEFVSQAGIPLVIAATNTSELESVIETIDGRAVVFAPFAEAPGLPELVAKQTTSVVSCKPNRSESIEAVISAISGLRSALENQQRVAPESATVIALSRDEVRYGYRELIGSKADVSCEVYDADLPGDGLLATLTRMGRPLGLLVAISGEENWASNIAAVEDSDFGKVDPPPFYLLTDRLMRIRDRVAHPPEIDPFATTPPANPLQNRVALLDYEPELRNKQVQERFAAALLEHTRGASSPELDYLHDCFYVAAYSALAAQLRLAFRMNELSPEAVLRGLSALGSGEPVPIGPDDLVLGHGLLATSHDVARPLDLVGGSGDLDFVGLPSVHDAELSASGHYVTPAPGVAEFFCVDPRERQFCETGISPSPTGEINGVNQCRCFSVW
jgi:hypothetical protein